MFVVCLFFCVNKKWKDLYQAIGTGIWHSCVPPCVNGMKEERKPHSNVSGW